MSVRRSREARRVAAWLIGIALGTACLCWAFSDHSSSQRLSAKVQRAVMLAEAAEDISTTDAEISTTGAEIDISTTADEISTTADEISTTADEISTTASAPQPALEDKKPQGSSGQETVTTTSSTKVLDDSWPCEKGEKLFFGRCFVLCNIATDGNFSYRDHECTCCKDFPCNMTFGRYHTDCTTLSKGANDTEVHAPFLFDCPYDDEELFAGLCYKTCTLLTHGRFPIRTGMNTCSNGEYGGNWTMGVGPCSGFGIGGTMCLPHIPQAAGMSYSAGDSENHGVAPMGFKLEDPPGAGFVGSQQDPAYPTPAAPKLPPLPAPTAPTLPPLPTPPAPPAPPMPGLPYFHLPQAPAIA